MKNLIVVGGGTAGLTSALILKRRFPNLKIKVIKSKELGIIGVGESSTEHWKAFIEYLGFTTTEVFQRTGCTYKTGVYFKNWTDKDYMHVVDGNIFDYRVGQVSLAMAELALNYSSDDLIHESWVNHSIDSSFVPNQMHFNTFKLNAFLLDKCEVMEIDIVEDTIEEVTTNEKGIDELIGKDNKYKADFYIDSSGFRRILISKLGAKWVSFNKYLTVNHAIAFPTEDTESYPPFTQSIAMKYGWMWRIPVWGRWGNGYVFNDNYINADQAKLEAEKLLGKKIEIGREVKFESGRIDKMWIKNCATVGLSSSFLEPLEATAIGTAIQQSFLLMHHLTNYNEDTIKFYNNEMDIIHQNMLDFVFLSYMVKKDNSEFWKMVSTLTPPDSLSKNLELWKTRLPIKSDIKSEYCLFYPNNWIAKMMGLGLLDKQMVEDEMKSYSDNIQSATSKQMKFILEQIKAAPVFDHKDLVSKIRQNQCPNTWPL